MERFTQFDRLIVEDFTTDTWEYPLHNHNYFELIFIVEGKGIHHLNGNHLPYRDGAMYLVGPEDTHEFIVEKQTRFIYFKFTKLYLDSYVADNPSEWNKVLDSILNVPLEKKGDLIKCSLDRALAKDLFTLIVIEYNKDIILGKRIIFQLFKTIILLIMRNKDSCGVKQDRETSSDITESLLEYIELNIYEPKMLTLKAMAEHFHYSANYIGTFFKEKVGVSLKNYIQQYRYTLLVQRLKHGSYSTKQLALEFGFTDESHLHKFIKGYTGKSFRSLKETTV